MTKAFPKPSGIVRGNIPDGDNAIKASKGDGAEGPTYEYGFSPDEAGPHKVEVFNEYHASQHWDFDKYVSIKIFNFVNIFKYYLRISIKNRDK